MYRSGSVRTERSNVERSIWNSEELGWARRLLLEVSRAKMQMLQISKDVGDGPNGINEKSGTGDEPTMRQKREWNKMEKKCFIYNMRQLGAAAMPTYSR
jgi:hypothetical protein